MLNKLRPSCLVLSSIIGCLMLVSGCTQTYTKQFFQMDTLITVTICHEDTSTAEKAIDAVMTKIREIENCASVTIPSSDIAQFNIDPTAKTPVQIDTIALLRDSQYYYQMTDGLFNPAIYSLKLLWLDAETVNQLPSTSEITATSHHIDFSLVTIDETQNQISCNDPLLKLDFGAIAKGYAAQQCFQILQKYDIDSAIISLGGNIVAVGKNSDGSDWSVGVRDPLKSENEYLGIVKLSDQFAATSGDYERSYTINGQKYTHIIDPRTGCPAESDLHSVTVISSQEPLCDALSTALYVAGYDEAITFWKNSEKPFELVLCRKDGSVTVTDGLQFMEKSSDWMFHYVDKENENW